MRLVAVDDNGKQIEVPSAKEIPGFIKENRSRLKMSLQAIAAEVGVSRQAVHSWEKGDSQPTMANLTKIVSLFDTDEIRGDDTEEEAESRLSQVESILNT